MSEKTDEYLGDGLYVADEGYMFELYASNGLGKQHQVFLEDFVLRNFLRYVARRRNLKITVEKIEEAPADGAPE